MTKQEKIMDFVAGQFKIHNRINDITTKEAMEAAMNENKVKWVKMAILAIG